MHITLINPYCPNNCRHCCYDTDTRIPFEDVKKAISQLQKLGHKVRLYDLSPETQTIELFKLTRQFEDTPESGFQWMNLTHQFPITDANISFLNSIYASIHYSLYGITPEKDAEITGRKDSFEKTTEHMKKLMDRLSRGEVGFQVILHKKNIDDIPGFIELGNQLGVDEIAFTFLSYINKARDLDDFFFDAKDLRRIGELVRQAEKTAKFEISLDETCGPKHDLNKDKCRIWAPAIEGYFCGQCRNQLAIMLGSNLVFPCAAMAGDPELAIGHFNDGRIIINKDWPLKEEFGKPCNKCKLLKKCKGGCRAEAIFEHLRKTGEYDFSAGQKRCWYAVHRD